MEGARRLAEPAEFSYFNDDGDGDVMIWMKPRLRSCVGNGQVCALSADRWADNWAV